MDKIPHIIAIVLLLCIFPACKNWSGASNPVSIGGKLVAESDPLAKSIVAVVKNPEYPMQDYCSATIVGPNLLLSAAHCNESIVPKTYVIFGKGILDKEAPKRKIIKTVQHEDFSRLLWRADIALIQFEGTLPEGFVPVNLIGCDYENFALGTDVVAYGFGLNYLNLRPENPLPQGGVLRSLDLEFYDFRKQHHAFHVMGKDGTGMCSGDSGGPVFLKRAGETFQIGLLSNGESRKCINERSEYTDIIHYRTWIESEAAKLGTLTAFSTSDNLVRPTYSVKLDQNGKPISLLDWCHSKGLGKENLETLGNLQRRAKTWDCNKLLTYYDGAKKLDLSYQYLFSAEPLASLTSLEELDISGNSITEICSLAKLKNLKSLNISKTRISDLSCLKQTNLSIQK